MLVAPVETLPLLGAAAPMLRTGRSVDSGPPLFPTAFRRSYHFNYPSTVTLLQILVSLVFMYALRAAGAMQFSSLTLQGARKVRLWPADTCSVQF